MKPFGKIIAGSAIGFVIASIVIGLIKLFSLLAIVGIAASAGSTAKTAKATGPGILKIDFTTPVTEQATETFGVAGSTPGAMALGMNTSIPVYSMVKAIERAAEDPNIKFIYMTPEDPGTTMSMATAEEVRRALVKFRESGKPIVSYSTMMTGEAYYLASVADKILFNTYGDPMIFGMSSGVIFFKDALDKLGIEMQLIRHGKYKAAGEQFTKNDLTPENREQNQAMIDALWDGWAEDIAASRDFTKEQFNSWLDNLDICNAQSLVDKGLVDQLAYQDEVDEYLCKLFGVDDTEDLNFTDIATYASTAVKDSHKAKNKIAVVYANGEIMVDTPADNAISGIKLAADLAEIRKDESIKAVVLRVNSPGGAAQGAEMINRELGLLKAEKPVIASYGDYAASGGYWISARADKIFCDKSTLTGSIGVFSMIPSFGKALRNKAGVNIVAVNSNKHSDIYSMMRPLDANETKYMEDAIEKVYTDFTSIVAEGRGMSVEAVDSLGQGRVWAGSDALEAGLVDECGGLVDAIRYAEQIAGFDEGYCKIVEYPAVKTTYEKLMEGFGNAKAAVKAMTSSGKISKKVKDNPVPAFEAAYSTLQEENMPRTWARMPYIFEFR